MSDSTGVRTAPQSLDDQLEAWQTLRSQLEIRLGVLMRMREELSSYLGSSDAVSARRSGGSTAMRREAA